ncbi:hypothetical protein EVA_06536 [gut metagenome]|uniref:Uncharacterized protein n=1 Tax=gut metagenome TaxID=749906 RepID=J9CYL2_9ZZZZ
MSNCQYAQSAGAVPRLRADSPGYDTVIRIRQAARVRAT